MSKLFELLTELAKRKPYGRCDLFTHDTGFMSVYVDGYPITEGKDESELITKLSEYLAKEKNQ